MFGQPIEIKNLGVTMQIRCEESLQSCQSKVFVVHYAQSGFGEK